MESHRALDYYIQTTGTFGDRPSGTISMFALRRTAEMSSNVKVTEMICKNSYVNDILQSVDSADEAESLITEVEETLKLGGFRVKHWIISGRGERERFNVNIIHSSLEKILGLYWKPDTDKFSVKVK